MANLNDEFLQFYDNLQITKSKRDALITSHNNLRKKIKSYFAEHEEKWGLKPCFYIQGSYKMSTNIRTKDDECDLDDGVYFIPMPDVSAETLQNRVVEAVSGTTDATPVHKNKCIRVQYAAGYHIDLPVYGKENYDKTKSPSLAVRDDGYMLSDPRQIVEWFSKEKDKHPQLIRIVCYFKAWADDVSHKMPSGLAWTTLAADNLSTMNGRDDIAFVRTAEKIKLSLEKNFKCTVHGVPYDDLFDEYDSDDKKRLLEDLQSLIDKGTAALEEKNHLKASKFWICKLGDRFPLGEDITEQGATVDKLRSVSATILAGKAATNRDGVIESSGVSNQSHKFYGYHELSK